MIIIFIFLIEIIIDCRVAISRMQCLIVTRVVDVLTYNYTQRSNIDPTTRYYRMRPASKDCVYNTNAVCYNGSLS